MEKIIQISINATLFSLEEGAYNKLSSYLNDIKDAFNDEVGGQEIIKDIEARIAEHLKIKGEQAITIEVIDEIISKMGTVNELTADNETENKNNSGVKSESSDMRQRLFRDEDNAILGGVCAGIAAYLDVDVTWVRVIFVALAFLGFGLIIPIYIILWLIIPPAETTSDRLEMHGNKVTLDSIADTVRARMNELRDHKKCKEDNRGKCKNKFGEKLGNFVRNIFGILRRTVRIFIGVFLTLSGFGMIIGSTATATALLTADLPIEFTNFIYESGAKPFMWLAVIAMGILILIPAIFIFLGGIAVLRQKQIMQVRYGFLILGIWMIALTTMVILGTHFGIRFNKYISERNREQHFKYQNVDQIMISPSTQIIIPN